MDDSEKIALMLPLALKLKEQTLGLKDFAEKMQAKASKFSLDDRKKLKQLGREMTDAYNASAAMWESLYWKMGSCTEHP